MFQLAKKTKSISKKIIMAFSFLNKVVIVTGSGSGIGKATALEFCKQGASVILNGRNEKKLIDAVNEFRSLGYKADHFSCDVTDFGSCQKLVAHTIKTFGTINVLVTNASISMNARFDKMGPVLFKKVLESNIYGTTMPIFASLDILKQTKGSIIFIGSVAGFYGMPTASAYSAGKMSLTALSQSLRSELHKFGVHVGIVYVGFTENDTDKKLLSHDGNWEAVPKRPRIFQQTQRSVARSVLLMVKYRRNKKTLSFAGKATSFLSRSFPRIIKTIIIITQKKAG
jgi:NAD(P)-dependent dehydrogenase (short-subunit alcohol dehydrogenase family)